MLGWSTSSDTKASFSRRGDGVVSSSHRPPTHQPQLTLATLAPTTARLPGNATRKRCVRVTSNYFVDTSLIDASGKLFNWSSRNAHSIINPASQAERVDWWINTARGPLAVHKLLGECAQPSRSDDSKTGQHATTQHNAACGKVTHRVAAYDRLNLAMAHSLAELMFQRRVTDVQVSVEQGTVMFVWICVLVFYKVWSRFHNALAPY